MVEKVGGWMGRDGLYLLSACTFLDADKKTVFWKRKAGLHPVVIHNRWA